MAAAFGVHSRWKSAKQRIDSDFLASRLLFALTFPPHPLLASTTSTCFRRRPALDIRGLIIFDMLTARTHRRVTISASSPSPLSSSAVQAQKMQNRPLGAGRVGVAGRRGAERRCVEGALDGGKIRKSTSNAPRVGIGGVAARSAAAAAFSCQLSKTKNSHFDAKCAEARREAPLRRRRYFSPDLRVLRSHPLTLYPSGKPDEDASTSSLAFSSRSRPTSNISEAMDLHPASEDASPSAERGQAPPTRESFSFAHGPSPLLAPHPLFRTRSAPPFARTSPLQSQLRPPSPFEPPLAARSLSEFPPPPATPSILVSNHYNSPREAHVRGST
ncbi:hypothetical protein EV714DRAFT_277616 [Schizophyllum commune]